MEKKCHPRILASILVFLVLMKLIFLWMNFSTPDIREVAETCKTGQRSFLTCHLQCELMSAALNLELVWFFLVLFCSWRLELLAFETYFHRVAILDWCIYWTWKCCTCWPWSYEALERWKLLNRANNWWFFIGGWKFLLTDCSVYTFILAMWGFGCL